MAAQRPDLETLLSEFVGLTGVDRNSVSVHVPEHISQNYCGTL